MRNWHDKVSVLELSARYRLNRNHNSSWGVKLPYEDEPWRISIYRPRKHRWAKAVAWNKKPEQCMTHVIKTQVTALHKPTGKSFVKTTWLCGSSTFVTPVVNPSPTQGCSKCYAKTVGVAHGEVKLQ